MKYPKLVLFTFIFFVFSLSINAQTNGKKIVQTSSSAGNQAAKSSPAYAEILLQKTELEAQLEDLLVEFKDDFPKVKELRFELNLIQKETDRFLAVSPAEAAKLTLALGKLTVRKIELETVLWNLQRQYNDEHPDVKQAKRKVEVFEKAIKEILP